MPLPFRKSVNEVTLYIPPDVSVPTPAPYILSMPPDRVIVSEEGLGMPPIDYITERGVYQDGETEQDYFLKPRIVQMTIRHHFCSRQAYWDGRAALLDILRPNRSAIASRGNETAFQNLGQGTLRRIQPNGTTRDLTCLIQQGPAFSARDPKAWAEWTYQETLRFIANDPLWTAPNGHSSSFLVPSGFTFPAAFPITFTGTSQAGDITNNGTWETFPTITAGTALDGFIITNTTTGDVIQVNYPIAFGVGDIVIKLTPGNKTVVYGTFLGETTNIIGAVSPASNLSTFSLVPGINNITVDMFNPGSDATITFTYNDRYLGI